MGRIGLAFLAFFKVLFDGRVAERVGRVFDELALPSPPEKPAEKPPVPKKEPPKSRGRSEALNLLAALQREARFVDFVKESLAEFSDAQIGAVARDVHRDCGKVLERMFAIAPLEKGAEGSPLEIPPGFEAARYRLTGNVTGQPPYRGVLCHHGWEATRVEVPEWTGSDAATSIVAPAEVELK